MKHTPRKKIIDLFLLIVLWVKAIDGVVELLAALVLALLSHDALTKIAAHLTRGELTEDPTSFIATHIMQWVSHFTGSVRLFFILYLISHGILRLFVVIGLLKRWLWVYPTAIIIFSLIIVYQTYRLSITGSLWLAAFTIFDVIVVWLIWNEYVYLKKSKL